MMKTLRKAITRTAESAEPAVPDLLPSEQEAARIAAQQKAYQDEVNSLEARRRELEGKSTLTEEESVALTSIPRRIAKLIHAAQALEQGLARAKSQARLDRARAELPGARAELAAAAPPFRAACEKFAARTRSDSHALKVQAILRALDEAGL